MPIFDDGAFAGLYGWCSTTASAPSASDAGPAAPPHAPTAIAARATISTPRTKTNLRPIPTSPPCWQSSIEAAPRRCRSCDDGAVADLELIDCGGGRRLERF